jgi:AmmeMemoRadiSam system protein A
MYNAIQQQQMLSTARESILHGLHYGSRRLPDHESIDPSLLKTAASFVTLKIDGQLRGCIGSLSATEALIDDIAYNAHSAAFKDARFTPLPETEIHKLIIHIAVLSRCEPIDFHSEDNLLQQLRPSIDGLVLSDGHHRATFLPSVWEQLEKPKEFLGQLKLKAGLSKDYWSHTIAIERYTVESVG